MRDRYYTILIPFEPDASKRTKWHPTEPPPSKLSTLTRGAFETEQQAHDWCTENMPGCINYRVRCYELESSARFKVGVDWSEPVGPLARELRRWLDSLREVRS